MCRRLETASSRSMHVRVLPPSCVVCFDFAGEIRGTAVHVVVSRTLHLVGSAAADIEPSTRPSPSVNLNLPFRGLA